MKKTLQLAITGLFLTALVTPVLAAENSSTNQAPSTSTAKAADANVKTIKVISVSNLLNQLQKLGYIVTEVKFDKDSNKYSVDALDRHGDKQSLDVDATTGLSADQKKQPHEVSFSEAAKKLEKNGSYIKDIEYNTDNYKATVVDKQGNEKTYTVDLKTGAVANS